jgi:hypothetical protein
MAEAKQQYDKEKTEHDAVISAMVPIKVHEFVMPTDTHANFNVQPDSVVEDQ